MMTQWLIPWKLQYIILIQSNVHFIRKLSTYSKVMLTKLCLFETLNMPLYDKILDERMLFPEK